MQRLCARDFVGRNCWLSDPCLASCLGDLRRSAPAAGPAWLFPTCLEVWAWLMRPGTSNSPAWIRSTAMASGAALGDRSDLTKALDSEVLLATELNGSPLSPAHGFPLRAVVPGWIGARSVKWLGRITLLKEPSANYFQSKAYRFQRATNPQNPGDVSAGLALSEVPVNAVILSPGSGEVLPAGQLTVRGWAMGSGGRQVNRIEFSSNAGQDWVPARITVEGTSWTWTFWQATVKLPRGRHVLAVKATDIAGATQPPTVDDTWNVKGYINNAWHRVAVQIV